VDLVLSEDPGPLNPDQTKFLKKTQKNVDRLNHLIADILNLTRLESGKSQIRLSPQPLHPIIQEVMDQHVTMAEAKGLFLKTDCTEAMPAVMCDPEKIHQVLWNLIDNAVKFTDSGGIKVSCRAQPEDNLYRVSVRDTGPGIPPEDQERIFEKFEQLGDATQHASGTGLGLALCQEIITRHQGTIWVEPAKQKGSCFCFTLPMQS
jgi:signal transduction histidine kinase